jgi:hypothetical protein
MRKISTFVAAACLVLAATGFGMWVNSTTTHARIDAPVDRIGAMGIMMDAKGLPTAEFVDYSLVFN